MGDSEVKKPAFWLGLGSYWIHEEVAMARFVQTIQNTKMIQIENLL